MNKEKLKNIFFKILKLLGYIVIAFVCFCVAFLVYYIISSQMHANDENYKPAVSIYTIVSPSMTPVIKVYDVVVNKRVTDPDQIQIGDIITYVSTNTSSEGMTITHRVIEINKTSDGIYEYRTQGDNNSEPDVAYVTFDNVLGKEIMIIPKLGRIQFLIANKKGWLFLLLVPVLVYIFVDIYRLISLLSLNKKVDKVVKEEKVIRARKKDEQHKREEIRKVEIKRELNLNESETAINIDEYEKSTKESIGFLEIYNEKVYSVGEIKETKVKEETKEEPKKEKSIKLIAAENAIVSPLIINEITMKKNEPTVEDQLDEPIKPTEIPEVEEKKTKKKEKVVIDEEIEILDTDELSSTIKKYTEKITELNNRIAALDKLHKEEEERISKAEREAAANVEKSLKQAEKPKDEFIEKDDFLTGKRIKVVSETPAKRRGRPPKVKEETEPNIEKIELKSASLYSGKKAVKKMARPEGEDVRKVNKENYPVKPKEEALELPKKKQLNLKPNTVKKINRKTTEKKEEPPKKEVPKKTVEKENLPKKKEKLIRIEKVK
jgi:signal peptidase